MTHVKPATQPWAPVQPLPPHCSYRTPVPVPVAAGVALELLVEAMVLEEELDDEEEVVAEEELEVPGLHCE